MEKSQRSSRGSPSPNRLTTRRPSSPSPKTPTPPPSRRLSTGSPTTRGSSPGKTSRGNSSSPKIKAWQANIPGFSTDAPPNLRTSLADRPASYVRGSSPASRSSRQSMSPTPSRSIGSFSPRSKGSVVSSVDDDVDSVPYVRKASGYRNNNNNFNKSFVTPKGSRTVSSSAVPKRSFDLALRQMENKRSQQNMFRPLMSSVPTSNFYGGKPTPVWNSSVTTSSDASSDLATTYAHEIEETEDDVTSRYVKVPDSTTFDDQVSIFEKKDSLNDDLGHESNEVSPCLDFGDIEDGTENLADCDTETSVVLDEFKDTDGLQEVEMQKDMLICSRCGCEFSEITPTEDEITLCENCQNSQEVAMPDENHELSQMNEVAMSDEDHESSQMNPLEVESPKVTQIEQQEDLIKDENSTYIEPICHDSSEREHSEPILEEKEPTQINHQVISQRSYSDSGSDQIQSSVDFSDSKADSSVLKKSNSIKSVVIRSGNFSQSSISYDDMSYMRESTNSMRSSFGRASLSASSSFDFGPSQNNRQLSNKKSEMENYKNHRRSLSSFSGSSSHAFHPSSVGTSTLDSFEVSNVHVGKDLADVASVETTHENDTENEDVESGLKELSAFDQTVLDSEEVLLHESSNFEDLGKDENEEDTSGDIGVENGDMAEVQLSVISEGEIDQSFCSSPVSECNVSQNLESNIEELKEPCDIIAPEKNVEALVMDGDTSNHASGIVEEKLVLIEDEGKLKGKSLTLEEATDAILFCNSIVHNLAYKAATIAIEKEASLEPDPEPSGNNGSQPLVPAIGKDRKEVETKKTSTKKSSKSKNTKEKKSTTKTSNTNTSDATELTTKPRMVYANNKENRKPLEIESKCNCSIM